MRNWKMIGAASVVVVVGATAAAVGLSGTAHAQTNSKLVLVCDSDYYGTEIVTLDLTNNNGNFHLVGGQVRSGGTAFASDTALTISKVTDDSIVWQNADNGSTYTLNRYTGILNFVWGPGTVAGQAGPATQCHKQEKQF